VIISGEYFYGKEKNNLLPASDTIAGFNCKNNQGDD